MWWDPGKQNVDKSTKGHFRFHAWPFHTGHTNLCFFLIPLLMAILKLHGIANSLQRATQLHCTVHEQGRTSTMLNHCAFRINLLLQINSYSNSSRNGGVKRTSREKCQLKYNTPKMARHSKKGFMQWNKILVLEMTRRNINHFIPQMRALLWQLGRFSGYFYYNLLIHTFYMSGTVSSILF